MESRLSFSMKLEILKCSDLIDMDITIKSLTNGTFLIRIRCNDLGYTTSAETTAKQSHVCNIVLVFFFLIIILW